MADHQCIGALGEVRDHVFGVAEIAGEDDELIADFNPPGNGRYRAVLHRHG